MPPHGSSARLQPICRPARGGSTRVLVDRLELILENARDGGLVLVSHDGRRMRRWHLPPQGDGQLVLHYRPPRFPLRVHLQHAPRLASGARTHGYVAVPLVPTIVWQRVAQTPDVIAEWLPAGMVGEWRDGGCVLCLETAWLAVRPQQALPHCVLVPVHLRHRGPGVVRPLELPLTLGEADLREVRGQTVAMPVRVPVADGVPTLREVSA